MVISDLTRLPRGHPPSPYEYPLPLERDGKLGFGVLPPELILCAVGWLGSEPGTTGPVPQYCVDRLFDAYAQGLVFSDGTLGWHDCEICSTEVQQDQPVIHWRSRELRLYGHGHHLIRSSDTVYMCPALILHYMLDHHYRPPQEFVQAVTNGEFLTPAHLTFLEQSEG